MAAGGGTGRGPGIPTNGSPFSARGAPEVKTLGMDAADAGKEPSGKGFCAVVSSNTMGFFGPSSMDGESGPIRSDCSSQPNCSVPGARRPDIDAIEGKTGLGVSVPPPSAVPVPDFSALVPAKLCSKGLGSMSSFEHACRYRMGLPPFTGATIGLSAFSSSADVAMMNGTEFVGEGGKSGAFPDPAIVESTLGQ